MPSITRRIRTTFADLAVAETGGRSMDVVLLHGTAGCKEAFEWQLASPMGDMYRLIAIDLPGHGASDDASDPIAAYTVRGFARSVAEALSRMEIERFALVGWSLGGHVAIELSSFHPGVTGLALTGTPPVQAGTLSMLRGFQANWDMLLASKRHFSERDAERFAALCFGEDADPRFLAAMLRADGRVRTNFPKSLIRGDGVDQKRMIETAPFPVAVINGADDHFVRLSYLDGLDYRSLFEKVHVIEGARHAAFWEAPQAYNPILQRFLKHVFAREIGLRREAGRYARIA